MNLVHHDTGLAGYTQCCKQGLLDLIRKGDTLTNNPDAVTCGRRTTVHLDGKPLADLSAGSVPLNPSGPALAAGTAARITAVTGVQVLRVVPADAVVLPRDVLPSSAQFDVWARQVASTTGYGWADDLGQMLEVLAAAVEGAERVSAGSAGAPAAGQGVSGGSVADSGRDDPVPSGHGTPLRCMSGPIAGNLFTAPCPACDHPNAVHLFSRGCEVCSLLADLRSAYLPRVEIR